jgi:hypothetical protein
MVSFMWRAFCLKGFAVVVVKSKQDQKRAWRMVKKRLTTTDKRHGLNLLLCIRDKHKKSFCKLKR